MSIDQFLVVFGIGVGVVGITGVGLMTWITGREDQRVRERHGLPRRR